MRIAMLASAPPTPCGVGDYAAQLVTHLRAHDGDVETFVISEPHWPITRYLTLRRRVRAVRPDVVHVQYPTVDFGASLIPLLLTVDRGGAACVLTVHEFSQAHVLRRAVVLAMSALASRVVFADPAERQAVSRFLPWKRSRFHVIGLGSNIPAAAPIRRNETEVVHFGLIRPHRGLEDFLALAALVGQEFRLTVVGQIPRGQEEYAARLQESTRALTNVSWVLDASPTEVAERLARARFAYLPFPDGASARRGSLLAALLNGSVVLTTRGPHTPRDLDGVVEFVPAPREAAHVLRNLRQRPERLEMMHQRARAYAARHDWASIAAQHLELYRDALRPGRFRRAGGPR